jgi:hypothetical protein
MQTGEWDIPADLFSEMYTILGAHPSDLFLRYDCSTQTLYVLVLATNPDFSVITSPPPELPGVAINDIPLPFSEFAWVEFQPPVRNMFWGWEASADLAPGTYKIIARTWVLNGGPLPSETPILDLVIQCTPTAVTLASFDAAPSRGTVALNWETATEVDTAGFNLYRARSESGAWTKVNDKLIAATGELGSGASYSYVDKPGYGAFLYKLEEVNYAGATTLYDLIRVKVAPLFRRPSRRPMPPRAR